MFFVKKNEELSNRDMEPGQTLFQYLKRKKHIALKQSVEKECFKPVSKEKEILKLPIDDEIRNNVSEIKQSARSTQTKKMNKKSAHKKKKSNLSFQTKKQNISVLMNKAIDQQQTARSSFMHNYESYMEPKQSVARKSPNRSFLSMISPLKNNQANSSLSQTKIFSKTQQLKSQSKMTQHCTKKMLKETMSKVQKHYNKEMEFEAGLRQKLKDLFLLVNGVLVQVQDHSQDWMTEGMEKKVKSLRSSMKVIHGLMGQRENQSKQVENINEEIQLLYSSVNQILDSFEGKVKHESQSTCQQSINRIRQQYQSKIDDLTKEKNRLSKQIAALNKIRDKTLKQNQKLSEKISHLQQKLLQESQQAKISQKEAYLICEQRIQCLTLQNKQVRQLNAGLQKKLKDSQYRFQQFKRKANLDYEQQVSQRENYLLKEINSLKNEFAIDINNLNKFYINKEEQHSIKIKGLEDIIQDQKMALDKLTEALHVKQQQIIVQEQSFRKSRVNVQDTLTDLYRLNQELYKHWLALKDVKTLLLRLHLFDKFQRIYKDIPFDDFLFVS